MKKWYDEDWRFRIEVIRVGKDNKAEECRLGLEPGTLLPVPMRPHLVFARQHSSRYSPAWKWSAAGVICAILAEPDPAR